MQPSIAQSFPESEMFGSDTFCSQDSFNPNSQSRFMLASTQEDMLSSIDSEQFSSFKPKRNLSKTGTAQRNPKKKVRFADDQYAPSNLQGNRADEFEKVKLFDLNATCPVDFENLDSDTSFEATSPLQQTSPLLPAHNTQQPNTSNHEMNGNVFTNSLPNIFTYNNLIPNVSGGKPNSASNPNYTYVMREVIVKKQDDLVSYTVQKSYQDDQLNSSIHQSVRVHDDSASTVVLEQREQVHNVYNGDVSYAQRMAFKGLGTQRENTRVPGSFAGENLPGMNFNSFDYDTVYNTNSVPPGNTFQFPRHGDQMQSQEFDVPSHSCSQHSEFGNPCPETPDSECIPSSQHSFTPNHDDEFVPNEFSKSRINSFNFDNLEGISPGTVSSQSNRSFSSQNLTLGDRDESLSPVTLEFTPIISKLEKQLSLESYDREITPHRARITDQQYL